MNPLRLLSTALVSLLFTTLGLALAWLGGYELARGPDLAVTLGITFVLHTAIVLRITDEARGRPKDHT